MGWGGMEVVVFYIPPCCLLWSRIIFVYIRALWFDRIVLYDTYIRSIVRLLMHLCRTASRTTRAPPLKLCLSKQAYVLCVTQRMFWLSVDLP